MASPCTGDTPSLPLGCEWSRNLVSNFSPSRGLNPGPRSLMAANVTTRVRRTPNVGFSLCLRVHVCRCVFLSVFLGLCVCVSVCLCVYMFVCLCVCLFIYVSVCSSVCVRQMPVCESMCVCNCVCVCMCVCVWVCVRACVYTSVCLSGLRSHLL